MKLSKDLYTTAEVMKILGLSRRTLYYWIENGNIKAVKVGRQWRVSKEEVERIANGAVKY